MQNHLILLFVFLSITTFAQNRIEVVIPSAEAEAQYIWQTLQDLPFFQQNNYQLSLPTGDLIEVLKDKALKGTLKPEDFTAFKTYFSEEVYDRQKYEEGYKKVVLQLPLLEKLLNQIDRSKRNWDFKSFPTYRVLLTLYGPGGSYDPAIGQILLYTTPEGDFKQYKNPTNTIIHEITHIGMEESIVQAFQVSHPMKERIVDQFVQLSFGKKLPNYQVQNMGETRIDAYLRNKKSLRNLDQHLQAVLKNETNPTNH